MNLIIPKYYFISDTHFSHERCRELFNRPFSCTHQMDEVILRGINDTVKENDILIHLGDFAGDKSPIELCRHYRDLIQCKNIVYIWGNHDSREIESLFFKAYDQTLLWLNDECVFLNHYPMVVWERSHKGAYQLYGHCHSQAEKELDKIMPKRRSMEVTVDNAYRLLGEWRPFSWSEILSFLIGREGYEPGEFINEKKKKPEKNS